MTQQKRTRSDEQDDEEQTRAKKAQKAAVSDDESGNEADDESGNEADDEIGSESPERSGGESPERSGGESPDVVMFDVEPAPGSPSSSDKSDEEETELTKAVKSKFLKAWATQIEELYGSYPKKTQDRRALALKKERDERTLARIGWVLEKLKPTRVCVAVLLTSDKKLFVYANTADDRLKTDLETLQQVASQLSDTTISKLDDATKETYDDLLTKLKKAAVDELRTGKVGIAKEKKEKKASRRLTKVLKFFIKYPAIIFQIHEARSEDKHAEMRAADAAEEGGAGSVGISKLCCGKCALALDALEQTKKVTFLVLGAHFKTYKTQAGWPVPKFLRDDDEAMKIFLGEKAFAIYEENRSACLDLIKSEQLASPSFRDTDLYSSEEEEWLTDDEEEDEDEEEDSD